jgi:lipopolysaccharide/colanic/teichoic acid biosynthesis glycosyltransferase
MMSNGSSSEVAPWPLHQRFLKRALDLAVSSVALVLGAPLFLMISGAIKLTSSGPVLFVQERVGRGGRLFRIWKFRTMVDRASRQGPAVTASGDPRVTPLGRWLRRSKLDEVPQLVNVWLGDMSLVGPRPEVPRYVQTYSAEDRSVLTVRPGITDLASILFRDEESVLAQFPDRERAYVEVLLPRKLALGRKYLRQQSFTADIALLLRTLRVVLRPRRRHRTVGGLAGDLPLVERPASEAPPTPTGVQSHLRG